MPQDRSRTGMIGHAHTMASLLAFVRMPLAPTKCGGSVNRALGHFLAGASLFQLSSTYFRDEGYLPMP